METVIIYDREIFYPKPQLDRRPKDYLTQHDLPYREKRPKDVVENPYSYWDYIDPREYEE